MGRTVIRSYGMESTNAVGFLPGLACHKSGSIMILHSPEKFGSAVAPILTMTGKKRREVGLSDPKKSVMNPPLDIQ